MKPEQRKVSVIVPVYNSEKYLHECVLSLQKQTLSEIEIWLIDDGSTDASGRICDELAADDARIYVIHKQNEGAGPAEMPALRPRTANTSRLWIPTIRWRSICLKYCIPKPKQAARI